MNGNGPTSLFRLFLSDLIWRRRGISQTPDDNSWAKEGHTIIGSSKAAAVGHTTLYLPV